MDIQKILKRQEGKTLEFKRDLSSPERILRAITPFTNTAGGILLVGVENATRRVRGVKDILAEENRLATRKKTTPATLTREPHGLLLPGWDLF